MNIVVCIKQVPGTNKVDIDPETGVLLRNSASSKMNPYDLYALESAFVIKKITGGKITVITMGPPQAESIIREAYMMGADEGYIMSDMAFAGSDVLATSYTLAQGIELIGDYDLIICGKQTTDGDTAQVGPAIAEHLNIPHVTWVNSIGSVTESSIVVQQNMAESYETVNLRYPCLVTVDKGIYTPRLPSYRRMLSTKDVPVKFISLKDLKNSNPADYGLNGSPTQVERIFQPEHNTEHIMWNEENENCAAMLYEVLLSEKFVEENKNEQH